MSERLPRITCTDLVRILEKAGYIKQRQKGSHLTLKRMSDGRRVTVPIHQGREVPIGTLKAILKDADISDQMYKDLLNK